MSLVECALHVWYYSRTMVLRTKCNRLIRRFALCSFMGLVFWVSSGLWLQRPNTPQKQTNPISQELDYFKQFKGPEVSSPKRILLWESFWGDPVWEVGLGSYPFERLHCKVKNCIITNKKKDLERSDAVLFHIQEISLPPPVKYPGQRWVFFMLESPGWSVNTLYAEQDWKSVFNWTMTYRLDSDVRLLYGSVRKKLIPSLVKPKPSSQKKLVAWIASNCWVQSQRDSYVAELEKYIPIDKYGYCGNMTCTKDWIGQDRSCLSMISKEYKFYLALENSFCKDYVTEKFFKVLPLDVVPVVRGDADYSKFVPHKWYINTAEFADVEALAAYLLELDKDDAKYQQYFRHRSEYDTKGYFGIKDLPSWCDLCEKLNNPHEPAKHYPDITEWWNLNDCRAADDY